MIETFSPLWIRGADGPFSILFSGSMIETQDKAMDREETQELSVSYSPDR